MEHLTDADIELLKRLVRADGALLYSELSEGEKESAERLIYLGLVLDTTIH